MITFACSSCGICSSLLNITWHINIDMLHSQSQQGLWLVDSLQVSGEDADDYKRTLRAQLKALIEREKDPLGPTEWVVCYIKPAASDPLSKGPKKVRYPVAFSAIMRGVSDQLPLCCMYVYTSSQSSKRTVTAHSCQPAYDTPAFILFPFCLTCHCII